MTNILQMQEILKSVPDQRLMQEMQQPTGRAPQYLVMTEIQRRKKVRDEYEGQVQEQQTTVAEDIVRGPVPQQPPMAPPVMPAPMRQQMQPQMQSPIASAQPPVNMERGGALYMQEGSQASRYFGAVDLNRLVSLVEAEAGNQDLKGRRAVAAVFLNRVLSNQFPDTIQGVAEQRTPGGGYQFSPLKNAGGDVDKLPTGSQGTRAAVLELLADFDGKNPVGDALYFQNPEISNMIFPALSGNYDNGKRNDTPFPDGVTKIGDHVFSNRYGNEKIVALEPVAFRVEDNALTSVDRKRLGTEEAMKITGAGEEVIMAESEPFPPEPSVAERLRPYLKSGIQTVDTTQPISEGIMSQLKGVRENTFRPPAGMLPTDEFQQAAGRAFPSELGRATAELPSELGAATPPSERSWQEKISNLFSTKSPDTSLDVAAYDPAYVPPREQTFLERIGALFPDLEGGGERSEVANRLRPYLKSGIQTVDTGKKITPPSILAQERARLADISPDANLPVAGYDPAYVPPVEPTAVEKFQNIITAALPPPTKKGLEARKEKRTSGDFENPFAGATDTSQVANVPAPFSPTSIDENAALRAQLAEGQLDLPIAPDLVSPDETINATLTKDIDTGVNAGNLSFPNAGKLVDAGASTPSGTSTPAGGGDMAELIAQIQSGRDDAKAMGLLTAGLGIMQQASQPGATLLSSIPGAAAGVKQYSSDKANLAKQQMALATLANQKRATEIAAQKAAQLPKYQAVRENLRAAKYNDPIERAKYFDEQGRPNAAFEELVIEKTKTSSAFQEQLAAQRAATTKNTWLKSQQGLAISLRRDIRKKWEKANKGKKIPEETLRDLVQAEIERRYNKWRSGVVSGLGDATAGTRTKPLSAYETKPAS